MILLILDSSAKYVHSSLSVCSIIKCDIAHFIRSLLLLILNRDKFGKQDTLVLVSIMWMHFDGFSMLSNFIYEISLRFSSVDSFDSI